MEPTEEWAEVLLGIPQCTGLSTFQTILCFIMSAQRLANFPQKLLREKEDAFLQALFLSCSRRGTVLQRKTKCASCFSGAISNSGKTSADGASWEPSQSPEEASKPWDGVWAALHGKKPMKSG